MDKFRSESVTIQTQYGPMKVMGDSRLDRDEWFLVCENKDALEDAWLRHLQDAMACCDFCYQSENTEEKKRAFMERWKDAGGGE